jgi:hypothetical protein
MNKNKIIVNIFGYLAAILFVVPMVYILISVIRHINIDLFIEFFKFLMPFLVSFWALESVFLAFVCFRIAVYFEHKNEPFYPPDYTM